MDQDSEKRKAMLKLFEELQLAEKEHLEDGKWYTLEDVDKELGRII